MKTCIIPDINENVSIDENSIVVDDKSQYENKYQDDYDDYYHDEDLGLLLQKFGNQYDRLMIKYMLLFLLKIKENMVPVNILLIFVFFMWTR
jgi:hypothetical protein